MTDPQAFETIYHEHKNFVYNLCLHYVLNEEDAQDITQEVFVKVHQHLHQYTAQAASLKTWVGRITINQCLDFLKARKTKKRFGFLSSLFHKETNEPIEAALTPDHPGVAAEDKESLNRLLRIIQSLPPNQQTAIILRKLEDRSQKEVAEFMNIGVKAVESLLQRAKENIRKKLTGAEGL